MGQVIDIHHTTEGDVPSEILWRYYITAHFLVASWWLQNDFPYPPEFMADAVIKLTKDAKYHAMI